MPQRLPLHVLSGEWTYERLPLSQGCPSGDLPTPTGVWPFSYRGHSFCRLPDTPFVVCRSVCRTLLSAAADQHHCRLPIYPPWRSLQQASVSVPMATAHKDGPTKFKHPTKLHTKPHQDIVLPRGKQMYGNVTRCMLQASGRRCVLERFSPTRNSRLPMSFPTVCQCPRLRLVQPFADPGCCRLPIYPPTVCRYTRTIPEQEFRPPNDFSFRT